MHRRGFLIAAGAGVLTASASRPAAAAGPALEGEAIRTAPDALRLDWSAKGERTAIFASSDPDARRALMRELDPGARGGAAGARLAVSPRPYFLLETADGRQLRVAERLLPLHGGRNFRDLGGYRSADGRQVRWGRIYRSGVMSGLTEPDMAYLSDLGVEVICDLRSRQERTSQPNPFLQGDAPQVVGTDYDMMSMASVLQAGNRAEAVSAFARTYIDFTTILAPQYTDMFARLVRRETPLAFNCSAGKDRSGVAAALILSVLGVPRETVIADYALSQVYLPVAEQMEQFARAKAAAGAGAEQAKALSHVSPETMAVILGSDPEVLRQALAEIDRQAGGPVELAKTRYGLTDAKIAHLRAVYLI